MSDVAKVITIIGSSPESFAKAAEAAVQEASKTLRGITGADVISMSAVVEGDRITTFRTPKGRASVTPAEAPWAPASRSPSPRCARP
jgi:flavin-binding protein dodecin